MIVSRGIDLSVGATVALSGVVGAIVYDARPLDGARRARDPRHRARRRTRATASSSSLGRVPHPFIVTLASLSIVRGARALGGDTGRSSRACRARSTPSAAARSDWLPYSFFVVARPRAAGGRRHDLPRLGPLALRASAATPTPRAASGIPVGRVLVTRLRAERPRGRRRRAARRPACIDAGSPTAGDLRGARLDRRRDHRRRRVRRRPRERRQRARRRVHDRRDPQRAQPAQRQRLLPVDRDRRGRSPGGRDRRASAAHVESRVRVAPGAEGTDDAAPRGPRRDASASARSSRSTASTSTSRAGEVLALLGDNGAGKSTLIKASAARIGSTGARSSWTASRSSIALAGRRRSARDRDRVPGPRAVRQPPAERQLLRRPRAATPRWLPRVAPRAQSGARWPTRHERTLERLQVRMTTTARSA